MKKLLLLLLCVPLIGLGQNRYHIDEVITPNDTLTYLKKDMSLVNGIVYVAQSGKLYAEIEFKDGKRDGIFKGYSIVHPGKLLTEANWKDGREHGTWKDYYENGQLQAEKNYTLGKLISQRCWDEEGNKIECEEEGRDDSENETEDKGPGPEK